MKISIRAMFAFFVILGFQVHAFANQQAIDNGVAWLASQQNTDGRISLSSDLSHAFQATTEALITLEQLDRLDEVDVDAAKAFIQQNTYWNTEFLARALLVGVLEDSQGNGLITQLLARQNADGGIGDFECFDSTPYDSAWALLALIKWGNASDTVMSRLTGALVNQVNNQDTWGLYFIDEHIETSAWVFRALWTQRNQYTVIRSILDSAKSQLLSKANGSYWQSDYQSALLLSSLVNYRDVETEYSDYINQLIAQQNTLGDWQDDVKTTALALRALYRNTQDNPDASFIGGTVVDAETGLPMPDVNISISGQRTLTVTTDANGYFKEMVVAGSYNVIASQTAYFDRTLDFSLQIGQARDLSASLQLVKNVDLNGQGLLQVNTSNENTSAGLSGVSIRLSNLNNQYNALTNSAGQTIVSEIDPGIYEVVASKAGYSLAVGSVNIIANQDLYLSLLLRPLAVAGDPTGTVFSQLSGQVVDEQTAQVIAGARLELKVDGVVTATVTTDVEGRYSFDNLSAREYELIVENGISYEQGTALLIIESGFAYTLDISLKPKAPFVPRTISGIVLDSTTNAPIESATITVFYTGGSLQVETSEFGTFAVTGIDTAQATVNVMAEGYTEVEYGLILTDEVTDLGQVRLRQEIFDQVLPELTISDVHLDASTSPNSLGREGTLFVTLESKGLFVNDAFKVLSFLDENNNLKYDEGFDIILNEQVAQFTQGVQTLVVSADIDQDQNYRDENIFVTIDSRNIVIEGNESNNTRSLASFYLAEPLLQADAFKPALKWHWNDSGGQYSQVFGPPLVGQFTDDNGDGEINILDNADILVSTFTAQRGALYPQYENTGYLVLIDGITGEQIWRAYGSQSVAGSAIGDVDNDGVIEIVTICFLREVCLYDNNGTLIWRSNTHYNETRNFPVLVDLDANGTVEIVVGRSIFDAEGNEITVLNSNKKDVIPITLDVDLDGDQEIFYAGTLFDHAGNVLWDLGLPYSGAAYESSMAAVGNFDDDDYPEIVIKSNTGLRTSTKLMLVEHDGSMKLEFSVVGVAGGGAITVADFDGDSEPEIAIAGGNKYSVLKSDGSLLWSKNVRDTSSAFTGSTLFDFNGDSIPEVVYADEVYLRIYDGRSGDVLFEILNSSGTAFEYPVVADIDGDGSAEVIVPSNDYVYGSNSGVRVFENETDDWMPTRSIWNQHAYSITNINDDGTIPRNPEPSWLTHNTYRLNTFVDRDARLLPDLTLALFDIRGQGVSQTVTSTVRVGNGGLVPVNNAVVSIYRGSDATGELLAQQSVSLSGDSYQDITVELNTSLALGETLFAVIDGDESIREWREDNNDQTATVTSRIGTIAIASNQINYAVGDTLQVTVNTQNTGVLTSSFNQRVELYDVNNDLVNVIIETTSVTLISLATNTQTQSWVITDLAAGAYTLKAYLYDDDGELVDVSETSVQILTTNSEGVFVESNVYPVQLNYSCFDTVELVNVVRNVSPNTLLSEVQYHIQVFAPNSDVLLDTTETLFPIGANGSRNVENTLTLNSAEVGVYSIQLSVLDRDMQLLSQSQATFSVGCAQSDGLAASVKVEHLLMEGRDTNTCTFGVSYLGASDKAMNLTYEVIRLDTTAEGDLTESYTVIDSTAEQATLSVTVNASNTTHSATFTNLREGTHACRTLLNTAGAEPEVLAITLFDVENSIALTGTITALQDEVVVGLPQTCEVNIENIGSAVESFEATLTVTNDTGEVTDSATYTYGLEEEQTITHTLNIDTSNYEEGGYTCAYQVAFEEEVILASTNDFMITCPEPHTESATVLTKPQENLIVNGSFEDDESCKFHHNSHYNKDTCKFKQITGWTVGKSHQELGRNESYGIVAIEGENKLKVGGYHNSSANQAIATKAGNQYELRFSYSPSEAKHHAHHMNNQVDVYWGDELLVTLDGTELAWTEHTFEVEAALDQTILRFQGAGHPKPHTGGLIDDVQLYCINCRHENLVKNADFEYHPNLRHGNHETRDAIYGWMSEPNQPFTLAEKHSCGLGYEKSGHVKDGETVLKLTQKDASTSYQDIPTCEGQSYNLRFDYSPLHKGVAHSKHPGKGHKLEIWWGDELIDTLSADKAQWQAKAYQVTANSNQTRLLFRSSGGHHIASAVLDKVELVCSVSDENLLINGSFESHPTLSEGNGTYDFFSNVDGWQLADTSEPFEIQENAVMRASDGQVVLELDANANSAIQQTVSVDTGYDYQLSFDYSPRVEPSKTWQCWDKVINIGLFSKTKRICDWRYQNAGDTNDVELWVNGALLDTLSGDKQGWTSHHYRIPSQDVMTNDGEINVTLQASGESDSQGGLIDNLRMIKQLAVPSIISEPVAEAIIPLSYRHQLETLGMEGDVSYRLLQVPEGMTINENGLMTWQEPITGDYTIIVEASDCCGGVATQVYELVVNTPLQCRLDNPATSTVTTTTQP